MRYRQYNRHHVCNSPYRVERLYRKALRAEEDPIVLGLVKILRKVNKVAGALQRNLIDQTATWAQNLERVAGETQQAYEVDWAQYNQQLGDLLEISGNLRDLDDGRQQQPERWIEFLYDQYIAAAELELQADQQGYPDDHPAFQLVLKIEQILNMELD